MELRVDPSKRNPSAQSPSRHSLQILEFWVILLLPWILDFFSGKSVFTSVFGALLWGVAVGLTSSRAKTRDPRFRRAMGVALLVTSVLWLLYWICMVVQSSRGLLTPTAAGESESSRLLVITHAGLLTAGAGMVLVLFVVSLVWLTQDVLLRKPSWDRRKWMKVRLPSLEALSKVAGGAINLAFAGWGLGFFLALVNANLKWKGEGSGAWSWITDPKVIVTAVLWILLVVAFQLGHSLQKDNRWLYRAYVMASVVFAFCFVVFYLGGHGNTFHGSIDWFSRR